MPLSLIASGRVREFRVVFVGRGDSGSPFVGLKEFVVGWMAESNRDSLEIARITTCIESANGFSGDEMVMVLDGVVSLISKHFTPERLLGLVERVMRGSSGIARAEVVYGDNVWAYSYRPE